MIRVFWWRKSTSRHQCRLSTHQLLFCLDIYSLWWQMENIRLARSLWWIWTLSWSSRCFLLFFLRKPAGGRSVPHRPAAPARELPAPEQDTRGCEEEQRPCHPPRLRVPVWERHVCRLVRPGRRHLHRTSSLRHRRHGHQEVYPSLALLHFSNRLFLSYKANEDT